MSGRRAVPSTRRRVGPGALVAVVVPVVLPVVVVLALLVLRPTGAAPDAAAPPATAPLTAAALSCPGAADDTGAAAGTALGVASLATQAATPPDGAVTLDATPLTVTPGGAVTTTTATTASAAAVLQATGDLAPALTATRSLASPLAATPCRPATSVQWFSGVGAAAEHVSVLELANSQAGPAVAEVTVYSASGVLDVPALQGLAVPAGTTTRVDLGQVVPRRGDLGLRVEVTRGRLGVAVLDRQDPLSGAAPSVDWLAPQAAPSTRSTLLGLTRGSGARTLAVVNPGDDEVGVTVSVVTRRATFAPEGLEEVRVPPGSAASLSLDDVLGEASRRGAVGVVVESTGPVTASLRQVTARGGDAADLSLLTAAAPLDDTTGVVLPGGRARLLLAGASSPGTVTVVATDAAGAELATREVELTPDVAAAVALPAGTALARVDVGALAGQVRGVVLAQGTGATVLPLADLPRTAREPEVRPGLP